MNIHGYKLCRSDLKELIQQVLEWLDAYASSNYALKPNWFVANTERLIVNIRPNYTVDGTIVLYDVSHEGAFARACRQLANEFFERFSILFLLSPGGHANFILEKVLPGYSLVMYAAVELDDIYSNASTNKDIYAA